MVGPCGNGCLVATPPLGLIVATTVEGRGIEAGGIGKIVDIILDTGAGVRGVTDVFGATAAKSFGIIGEGKLFPPVEEIGSKL